MERVEIVMYDHKNKRDIDLVVDVYSIDEMIDIMNKSYVHKNCFLIKAMNKTIQYSKEAMQKLKHEYLHCFLLDRHILMIEE